jgi:hypothetical protein
MHIAVYISIFIISAVICHFVAKHRGSRAVFWGVMGAVFGPLAIPFVFFAKTTGRK